MKGRLQQVTYDVLYALLSILHRRGVSFGEFGLIAKKAFVDVAKKEIKESGDRVTTSRIAVSTGLTRKEVSILRKNISVTSKKTVNVNFNRSTRVITGWMTDKEFHNKANDPSVLPLLGEKGSFEILVNRYSGDIPYRAMLQEMTRVGVIAEKRGYVSLLTEGYLPKDDSERLHVLGEDIVLLLDTIGYNLTIKAHDQQQDEKKGFSIHPRFQRKVKYNNLPEEAIPGFVKIVNNDAMELLIKLNDYLSKYDRDRNPSSKGTGKIEAGIGIYYFEKQLSDSENQDT